MNSILYFSLYKKAFVIILAACFLLACDNSHSGRSWSVYRGDDGINAYSRLDQINKENVKQLEVAWTYRTGDQLGNSTIECNPIVIHGVLYALSPKMKAFALEAKTGKELWVFDPFEKDSLSGGVGRGLSYWEDGDDQRILMSASHRLMALDANTGKQIMTFGEDGYVDLRKGLRNDEDIQKYNVRNTSPGVIYQDLIIVGSSMGENYESLPGHIRAYDIRTGKMQWIFHTIPQPGEFGYDTWPAESYKTTGGCNAWSGLSIDRKRGMVFAATGSPSFDFHGGDRLGSNLFGNSVIALNAATGKYIWHFQVCHHDLWDYDLPSPPNLITIQRDGKEIDAVAQITKQGWIFVFDRETGSPLFPIEEKAVPRSGILTEQSSPTQPYPSKPPALSRQKFDTSIVTDISPESREHILKEVSQRTWGEIYLPPTAGGIIQIPGFRGGGEWSGAAFDSETGIMYIGTNEIPNIVQLVELDPIDPEGFSKMPILKGGQMVYLKNCASCHGENRQGVDPFPSLTNIKSKLSPQQALEVIEKGRGKMPAFMSLPTAYRDAVIAFLFDLRKSEFARSKNPSAESEIIKDTTKRYRIKGYTQFLDQFGYPGVKPPWGMLNAVDLNSGEIVWKKPLGQYPELVAKGHVDTGTQLFGGGIVTAGGLIFIGASNDERFRAIDKKTGEVLWEHQLPAGGYATPATYEIDGKQFVVIGAGGGGLQPTKSGDYYIAFALPGVLN